MQEWKRWRCSNGRRKYIYTYARDCQPQWDQETNAQMELSRTNSIPFSFYFFLPFVDLQIPFFPCLGMNNIFLSSLFHVSLNGWRIERVAASNRVVWLKRVQPYRIRLIAEKTEEEEGGSLLLHNWTRFLFGALLPRRFDRPIFFFLQWTSSLTERRRTKSGGKKRKKRNDGKR